MSTSSTTEILEDSPIDSVALVLPPQPHDDYGPQINLTLWSLSAVAAIWLVVRVYCKLARRRGLWWDDHVLLASWVRTSPNRRSACVGDSFAFILNHVSLVLILIIVAIVIIRLLLGMGEVELQPR